MNRDMEATVHELQVANARLTEWATENAVRLAATIGDRDAAEEAVTAISDQADVFQRWGREQEARAVRAEEALRYVFDSYLPTATCHGPRDCVGTTRGCSHCVPDARMDAARALADTGADTPLAEDVALGVEHMHWVDGTDTP